MGKKTSWLNYLFILPEQRNLGLATLLFELIKDWEKESEPAWWQWNTSPRAIEFYVAVAIFFLKSPRNRLKNLLSSF
jgi:GNAT superfamily N-acetyltransferase